MATTSRQTAIFGLEDWRQLYQTYREADFRSYDFETLRKSFIDYLRQNYPESFNDYIESSEFVALLDVVAFMGQALSFRNDLNTRENFIDTAERRDSVVRLANLVGYTPKRNETAQGLLKVLSIRTTENIFDFAGNNLSNIIINWNDTANTNWLEQFTVIFNSALVSSQRFGKPGESKSILGIKTDEYTINLVPGYLPVVPFTSTVNNISMGFEAVSATSVDQDYLYEPAPRPGMGFNVVYRNDQLGFASNNTGFFFLFKQGSLQNYDFNLAERVNNRGVAINIEGINNKDVWLYQLDNSGIIRTLWQQVDSIFSQTAASANKNVFSITSRTNDQITLNFGDGIFSTIPIGLFRSYVRASNGLKYIIGPEEMQNVDVALSYTSRVGRLETITFNCGLSNSVSNATPRESIDDIKTRAPSKFYTQNRMVNGEDYTSLPYTLFGSVIKSKAVNRSSIGASRYLELVDITGKYSSTNIFGSDGVIYEENVMPGFGFTFTSLNEIIDVITNQVEPILAERSMQEFYYKNYNRPDLSALGIVWHQSTSVVNETTGYFKYSATDLPASIGTGVSGNRQYVTNGSLVKFQAPAGHYFNNKNQLTVGTPTGVDEKIEIWATISGLILDGTNYGAGNMSDGSGPVTINNSVPTDAIAIEVIPSLRTDLSVAFETQMRQQIELYKNFGIGFDQTTGNWYIITETNLNIDEEFSNNFAQDTADLERDASWLVQFTTDGVSYTVKYRNLRRYFSSVVETRFFYDNNQNIYDPKTGKVVNDYIKVLKVNNAPDLTTALTSDILVDIVNQPVESDGFVDDSKVQISFYDSDYDGIPDDPDYFENVVAPNVSADTKKIFLQRFVDFDNLERYIPTETNTINLDYDTLVDIELVKENFVNQQVFYAGSDQKFYILTVDYNGVGTLAETTDYAVKTGRAGLYFQYRHNSPSSRRIDPSSTNLIDVFLVTTAYYDAYRNYINDNTGTIAEPIKPTLDELTTAYGTLNDYKMISDNLILNSVTFKPLFGTKASEALRAKIKVIKSANTLVSDSEIKSQVVAKINEYFTIDKWDFGSTFYFSELAAYLHASLGEIISTVVLVPVDPLKTFGGLYEIRSSANEIFVNASTVNDVYVIDSLTSEELNSLSGVA